ncbi:SprT-like domain-containing protein, partial [Haematococcus lacustris]
MTQSAAQKAFLAGRVALAQELYARKIACRLELSSKLLVSEARLRTTLAHEMCHVGAWELDKEWQAPHGPAFWRWAGPDGV